MNSHVDTSLSIVLNPARLRLQLRAEQNGHKFSLADHSLPFLVIARKMNAGTDCAPIATSLLENPRLEEVRSDSRAFVSCKKYWAIAPTAPLPTERKIVRYALNFYGESFVNDLLPHLSANTGVHPYEKSEGGGSFETPEVYSLFKSLAQRETLYFELKFKDRTRLLSVQTSLVLTRKSGC